ncbi:MAG: hypothetical protein ABSC41_12860 [Acidimicrobiales bacterium]
MGAVDRTPGGGYHPLATGAPTIGVGAGGADLGILGPKRGNVLFVHEVHSVVGKGAAGFEDAYRDGWMPMLAKSSDARLLWYFDHAHGSGPA